MAGLGINLGFMGKGIAGTKVGASGAFGQQGNPLGRISNIIAGAYTGDYMRMAQGIAGDSGAGKALSLYNTGQGIADKWPSSGPSGSTPIGNTFDYGEQHPMIGAMNRKLQLGAGGTY